MTKSINNYKLKIMIKIAWITGDYFIDVDFLLVPYMKEHFKNDFDITWIVIKSRNSNIHVDETLDCNVISLKHRNKDPRVIVEYLAVFKQLKDYSDIIYSDFVGVPFYYPMLLNYIGKTPIVHAAHNVIPYPVWPWYLGIYVKYIFRKNKYFHFFSRFTAEYFKKRYPLKSFFYCPMTLKGYGEVVTNNYNIDSSKLNLLFFGNVVLNKRLDLLIEAVKGLPTDIKKKVHLTVAGKCNSPQSYLEQIGNDASITVYFKRIDDSEVAELFTKHDFLVLPYQDVAQSGPHMIAYYYNLPVIASNIDGFKERIIDGVNGLLFKSMDVVDLKDKIVKAANMTDSEMLKMRSELKVFAKDNYSLEKVCMKYVEYFNSITK